MKFLDDVAHYAAAHGHVRLLRAVHALGVNVNTALDLNKETVLHRAIRGCDADDDAVVRELVCRCGATVSVVRASPPKSHVRLAVEQGKVAALKILLSKLPASYPKFIDNCGETMLFWAVEADQVATARYLLSDEVRCDAQWVSKFGGDTVLGRAVAKAGLAMVALLLDGAYGGIDVNTPVASGQQWPLHIAALRGRTDMCELLLARGATVDCADARVATPLHLSVDVDVTSLLLHRGADIDAADRSGTTALHRAAAKGNARMAEHLLQHGATVHAKDAQGETPFRVAVDNGHLQLAASLLAVGAAIDAQDNCGFTAVHECAHMGQLDALAFLLARGADVNAVNAVGQAPLDVAAMCVRKNRRGDVTRLLLECGARPSPFLASVTTSSSSSISMPSSTPVRSQRNFACFVSNLEQTQEDTDDEDDG